MLGYEILAQALAKQGVQHTYGIVGTQYFTKVFPLLNLDSPFRELALITMDLEMNSKLPILLDTLAISLVFLEFVYVYQGQDILMP